MESEPLPESVQELSVLFTSDSEIQALNKDYRGKDSPTDVLSFSQLEGEESLVPPLSLGDLVISLDTAERQAKEFDVSFENEILRLTIHGILHLFGYDHENVSQEEIERMHAKETTLFKLFKTNELSELIS